MAKVAYNQIPNLLPILFWFEFGNLSK